MNGSEKPRSPWLSMLVRPYFWAGATGVYWAEFGAHPTTIRLTLAVITTFLAGITTGLAIASAKGASTVPHPTRGAE